MLSNTLAYHFRTIITRFLNEWKISGKHLNFGPVTLRDMSLMKAFNLLLPVFMPNSSCSFSSFCEWGLGLGPGGVKCRHFTGDWRMLWGQYAQDVATLRCNSLCCERVLVLLLRVCVNQNEHQQIFRVVTVNIYRAYKAILETNLPGSECMALLLTQEIAPSGWGWCHCVQELLLQWAEMQIVTHMPCSCTTEVKRWSYLSISSNRKFYGLRLFFLGSSWCLN